MIDGNATTNDWQTHTGRVCVWGIGSFEQHSRHLPLATDNLRADHFARMIAEDLDAALLPTLPIATCLEQTGFRGSVTLRPETLMKVVRDVADEVERQRFAVLVIFNSHGGNHCLIPVIRDHNRQDRPLKILLVNSSEHVDPALASQGRALGLDIHAGESETSVMLALRPELVKDARADMPLAAGPPELPLRQGDLTSFGVGNFAPDGALGFPSFASREKGLAIVESIRSRMLPYVRDRVARLLKQRRYAGSGGIALRPMTPDDIPDGMRLKESAGWNQLERDWDTLLAQGAGGCFVAVADGQVVGTTTTLPYADRVAWIGMVLVDPAFRRLGIAARLMDKALAFAAGRCACVGLDATSAGRPVYEKLGFLPVGEIVRLTIPSVPAGLAPDPSAAPLGAQDLAAAIAFDAETFGLDRGRILADLHQAAPQVAWRRRRRGRIDACCFGRPGAHFHQVGPVSAATPAAARAVTAGALAALHGRPVAIDVPREQDAFLQWLLGLGFAEQRCFTRMLRGAPTTPGRPARRFAIAGPELG